MTKPKSVVLLSGGMDSTYAAVWAMKYTHIMAFLWVDYGQRGAQYERATVDNLMFYFWARYSDQYPIGRCVKVELPAMGTPLFGPALIGEGDLTPGLKDKHGNPLTYVPARNLIMLGLAANLAYSLEATKIVGGWSQVDVDYPDCTDNFLQTAEAAINLSLGFPLGTVRIKGPCLHLSKAQSIALSTWGVSVRDGDVFKLAVPWELTRSCYGDDPQPCGKCDSCLVRARAFIANDMQDPIYPIKEWVALLEREEAANAVG